MSNFLSQGQTKGLSYQHDWGKDIDSLYKREAYASEQQEITERKSQYYGKLLAKPENMRSQYNSKRLDKFYQGKMEEIGDFITRNPGFERDIGLQAKFNELSGSIINNDIVREELQVEEEFNLLKQNRTQLTEQRYNDEMARYEAYFNQDPEAEEKADPYFFNKHLVVDPVKIIEDAVGSVALETRKIRQGGESGRGTRFHGESLERVSWDYYNVEENKHAIDGHFKSLPPEDQKFHGSGYEWFKSGIRARENKDFIAETVSSSGSGTQNPFDEQSPFVRHVGVHLMTGNVSYASGNPDNIAFSPFAEAGKTLSMNALNELGGAFFLNPSVVEGEEGSLGKFNVGSNFKAVEGGGRMIERDGVQYVSVMVKTEVDSYEALGDMGEELKKRGFRQGKTLVDGYGRDLAETKGFTQAHLTLEGEIWVPATFDERSSERYNKASVTGGQKEIDAINRGHDQSVMTYMRHDRYLNQHENQPLKGATGEVAVELENGSWGTAAKKGNKYVIVSVDKDFNPIEMDITKEEYESYKQELASR